MTTAKYFPTTRLHAIEMLMNARRYVLLGTYDDGWMDALDTLWDAACEVFNEGVKIHSKLIEMPK